MTAASRFVSRTCLVLVALMGSVQSPPATAGPGDPLKDESVNLARGLDRLIESLAREADLDEHAAARALESYLANTSSAVPTPGRPAAVGFASLSVSKTDKKRSLSLGDFVRDDALEEARDAVREARGAAMTGLLVGPGRTVTFLHADPDRWNGSGPGGPLTLVVPSDVVADSPLLERLVGVDPVTGAVRGLEVHVDLGELACVEDKKPLLVSITTSTALFATEAGGGTYDMLTNTDNDQVFMMIANTDNDQVFMTIANTDNDGVFEIVSPGDEGFFGPGLFLSQLEVAHPRARATFGRTGDPSRLGLEIDLREDVMTEVVGAASMSLGGQVGGGVAQPGGATSADLEGLQDVIASDAGLTSDEAEAFLAALTDVPASARHGGRRHHRHRSGAAALGTVSATHRAAQVATDPQSGMATTLGPRLVLQFKAGKAFAGGR